MDTVERIQPLGLKYSLGDPLIFRELGKSLRTGSGRKKLGLLLSRLNEQGNGVLQVVLVLSVLIIGVYFISSRLVNQRNVVLQTSSLMRVRYALHSVLDYAYFAVQRRFCFDNKLMESETCELNQGAKAYSGSDWEGRSIERVLLSNLQASFMSEMLCKNHIDMGLEDPFKPSAPNASQADITNCMNNTNNPSKIRRVKVLDIAELLDQAT